jgi:hypothetical protein
MPRHKKKPAPPLAKALVVAQASSFMIGTWNDYYF